MKDGTSNKMHKYARVAGLFALIAVSISGAARKVYSPREKAYYTDPATVEFVRPGLTIKVNSAQIAAEGTISVVYTVTDPAGLPLDAAGVSTPGAVILSYIAAALPNNADEYTTYTTRSVSGSGASALEPRQIIHDIERFRLFLPPAAEQYFQGFAE